MAKKTVKKKATKKKAVKRKGRLPRSKTGLQPRLSYDEVEYIKALLVVTPSLTEVARITGHARDTIRKIRDINADELDGYRQLKTKDFIKKSWEKIDMLMEQVTRGKCAFATVNQVTTALGTIYDKAALASGGVTERIQVNNSEEERLSRLSIKELSELKAILDKTKEE